MASLAVLVLLVARIDAKPTHSPTAVVSASPVALVGQPSAPTPTPAPELPAELDGADPGPTPAPCAGALEAFTCGYQARAQGDPYLEAQLPAVLQMVRCEDKTLNPAPGNPAYVGLSQLEVTYTWPHSRRAPDADPADPWEQGWATADWLSQIADPASLAGWAVCWPR